MTEPTGSTGSTELTVLHAVRTLGYADVERIAGRTGLPQATVTEALLDAEATGRVSEFGFGGDRGWSLTEAGKAHGEALLATELAASGGREVVEQVHQEFLPFNTRIGAAMTAWQLADPGTADLAGTRAVLVDAADALADWETRLTPRLPRFTGYHARFAAAVAQVEDAPGWITDMTRDSCHRVWFELHEDLLATLGLAR